MTTTAQTHAAVRGARLRPTGGLSRWQKAIGVLGLVVVFWVGDRLYTVIDRGGTGPGMSHRADGRTPTAEPTAGDNPTPAGEEPTPGHDPSQFDH